MQNYFYLIDMWDNGQPLFSAQDRPESVRSIPGSTHQELFNNSGFNVFVSFSPVLGPSTPGGPGIPMPGMPPVHLRMLPGERFSYSDHPVEAIQIWLDGGAPIAYAPVEVRAW